MDRQTCFNANWKNEVKTILMQKHCFFERGQLLLNNFADDLSWIFWT